eukprot:4497909-Pyramimonas_sp.AAC.1
MLRSTSLHNACSSSILFAKWNCFRGAFDLNQHSRSDLHEELRMNRRVDTLWMGRPAASTLSHSARHSAHLRLETSSEPPQAHQ